MSDFKVHVYCRDGIFSKEEIFEMIDYYFRNSNLQYRGLGFHVSDIDNPQNIIEKSMMGEVTINGVKVCPSCKHPYKKGGQVK